MRKTNVKDRSQEFGWLILFLIASGFFGFISAHLMGMTWGMAFLIVGTILTIIAFSICAFGFQFYRKKAIQKELWSMLARGCYHEVERRIDENGKEMDFLWELKMLAVFHSGNMPAFDRLYKEYMNDINECKTLGAYMLCIIKDLMLAVSSNKPPVAFLKNNDLRKHGYTKLRDYQLYRNLRLGLQEYYGSQKQTMKIYFEKFLMQTEVLSKPMGFYLYYLMTSVMVESDHPQCSEYLRKTVQFVFDQTSLAYVENVLKPRMYELQKGTGTNQLMDREFDRNRRSSNPLFDEEPSTTRSRTFNYQQPAFRRDHEEQGFASRRRGNDVQQEFDAMNSTLPQSNAFPLYEEDEMDVLTQSRGSQMMNQRASSPLPKEDISDDLDPTWFARKAMEEPNNTANTNSINSFARRTPSMSEPIPPVQTTNRNPMAQDPFLRSSAYQDEPQFVNPQASQMEEPAFVNQRTMREPQMTSPQMQDRRINPNMQAQGMQAPRQPMYQQPQAPQQPQHNTQPQRPMAAQPQNDQMKDFISAQNPMMQQASQPVRNTSNMRQPLNANTGQVNDRYHQFDEPIPPFNPNPQPQPQAVAAAAPATKKKRFGKKKEKQDPFGFDNPNAIAKDPYHQEQVAPPVQPKRTKAVDQPMKQAKGTDQPYATYVKHNIIIFFISLLDACFVAMTTSSVVYMEFFYKFSSIKSDIISDIVFMALIITIIIAYLTAGIHTGYTILKKSIRAWNPIAKVLLSPLLLIISLLIGAICEIPYLIFATIKKGSE